MNCIFNPFKTKLTFNPRNKCATKEIYLSSLEEKLLKIEVPKDKFNNVYQGVRDALQNLKNDKTIVMMIRAQQLLYGRED